jgi:hypothetical protein
MVVVLLGLVAGRASALSGTITTKVGTGTAGFGPWPGPGTSGDLSSPHGVVYDPALGAVFISDTTNCDVLEDVLATGNVSVVVNGSAVCGSPAVPPVSALSTQLDHPWGLALDQSLNLLYIADRDNEAVEVVDLSSMTLTRVIPFVQGGPKDAPTGVSVDQKTHDLYVADQGVDIVWRVPLGGNPVIFAGVFDTPGFNGNKIPATAALLDQPTDVFFDSGVVYVADTMNNEIRSISGGTIFDVVGSPGAIAGFSPDGSPPTSPITAPSTVSLDGAGTIFYDEDGFNLVREIDPTTVSISTVAGTPPPGGTTIPYSGDLSTTVALNSPHGLTFVPESAIASDVWFSDTNNNVVDSVAGVAAAATMSSPGIDSANTATGAVGQSFTFLVTTTGSPTPKIKAKGKLPKGLKFNNNRDGTATISGTATSTKHKSAVGLYKLNFTAVFGKGHSKVVTTQHWALRITM